jgi:F0F1-type ATP synthase assembly protein I
MLGLGSQMFSEVAAGVLLGYGLDYALGTKSRWIVVGSLAGVAVAMVSVIRVALRPQTPRRRIPSGPTSQDAPSKTDAREAGEPDSSRPNDDPRQAPRP